MQKRVLITGVAGFIGSNLLQSLLAKNYHVIGVDNLSQGNIGNIELFLKNLDFEFFKEDVKDFETLRSLSTGIDSIIHLAAFKIPRYSDAMDTLLINSETAKNVLEVARINKSKVLLASTSDVYGKNTNLPFHEEADSVIGNPKVKRWSYAISKMFDEQLCFAYQSRYSFPTVIMRFFGSYGPNQHIGWWGGPQSVFIDSALKQQPLDIHGNGQQTRSFTYVTDTVNGIVRCLENEKANGEVINIGSTEEVTILDLAERIWKLANGKESDPNIKMIPYETFGKYEDVMRRVPDITKANRILNFIPEVSLDNGLIKTIKWQKEYNKLNPVSDSKG
jgi:UDP-glucose 4-epimerase